MVDAFFAGIALAFVVAVWAMHPKVGDACANEQTTPKFKARGVFFDSTHKDGTLLGTALWACVIASCLCGDALRSAA